MVLPEPSGLASHWDLDPDIVFLNHGSFGACPRVVLARQQEWRARLEREPVLFLGRQIEGLLDEARASLARLVRCDPDDLALVPNATAGVNAVLRSLDLARGDELLVTDHEYNACRNVLDHVAERAGARVVVAPIPFPLLGDDQIVEAVSSRVGPRTRLLLIDHVTSPTGIVMPVEKIVHALAERGVDCLVDGAHAPGMVDLDLGRLGAAYYTGNCHKWLCTPKGSALLFVRRDRQTSIRPTSISHGANSTRTDRSRFRLEFDWTGTCDPTPWLCIPEALGFLEGLLPGGLCALRERNRTLAIEGRARLLEALHQAPPVPENNLGSLASVILPPTDAPAVGPLGLDPLQVRLFDHYGIEVPVMSWPSPRMRLLRISAQAYNSPEQYAYLAAALEADPLGVGARP
ncbi:MAG: aminotransferase class V-fold PLP-dependent enzyme [Planctomycetota bacterium]